MKANPVSDMYISVLVVLRAALTRWRHLPACSSAIICTVGMRSSWTTVLHNHCNQMLKDSGRCGANLSFVNMQKHYLKSVMDVVGIL